LIFATGNRHKLRELRELLPGVGLDPLPDDVQLPPEEGETFAEIALVKARTVSAATGEATVADDSGIEAAGLGGRPGIYSARFAGEGASDEVNLEKLLREVAVAGEDRRAAYVCALAFIDDDGAEHVFEARCEGYLTEQPRGEGGFGYDPILQPVGESRSCAELSSEEKNAISHRGKAFRALVPAIVEALARQ
jgi:XTP/dITP diphosphohydrolase